MNTEEIKRFLRHFVPVSLAGFAPVISGLMVFKGYLPPDLKIEATGAIMALAGGLGYTASKARDAKRVSK